MEFIGVVRKTENVRETTSDIVLETNFIHVYFNY